MIHHKFYSLRKSHFRGLLSGPGKEKVWKRTVCIRKKASGTTRFTIADLVPVGRENAISRKMLTQLCVQNSLIDDSVKDKDRAMRNLLEKDRRDFVILNLSTGEGYYRPTVEDIQDLQRYIRQEESRAKASFRNLKKARALYEDFKHGRLEVLT